MSATRIRGDVNRMKRLFRIRSESGFYDKRVRTAALQINVRGHQSVDVEGRTAEIGIHA